MYRSELFADYSMARGYLPPGFRFRPSDVELVMYYLKRKVMGRFHFEAISQIELYKFDPLDLPEKSCLQSGDLEWYFFCQRDKKYSTGERVNRTTKSGFWKPTGNDRPVYYNSQKVGMIKTLSFHMGRAPQGRGTNWMMYEYRLEDKDLGDAGILQDSYVVCKIFEKSDRGPKKGEQYAAPFNEEDWDDDVVNQSMEPLTLTDPGSLSLAPDDQNMSLVKSTLMCGSTCESSLEAIPYQNPSSNVNEMNCSSPEDDNVVTLLENFDKEDYDFNGNDSYEKLISSNVKESAHLDGYGVFNVGLEDLGSQAKLKTIDEFHSPSSLEVEYAPDRNLLRDDGSFLELNDLKYPVKHHIEANGSKLILLEDLCTFYKDNKKSKGLCNPVYTSDAGVPSVFLEGCQLEDQLAEVPTVNVSNLIHDEGFGRDVNGGYEAASSNLAAPSGSKYYVQDIVARVRSQTRSNVKMRSGKRGSINPQEVRSKKRLKNDLETSKKQLGKQLEMEQEVTGEPQ